MRRLTLIAIAIIVLCSLPLRAQTVQTTWQQNAFTNVTAAAGNSVTFRNVNQGSSWLTWCVTGVFSSINIWLQESADGVNWQTISPIGTTQCGVIQAGGYYYAIRASYNSLAGTGTVSLTATYTASTGVISAPGTVSLPIVSQPETYYPITCGSMGCSVYQVKSAGSSISSGPLALYGATAYNPNAGTVYVTFMGGGGGSSSVVLPLAAGQAGSFQFPVQGIFENGVTTVACSTSLSSPVDPATACVVNPYFKPVAAVGQPPN